MFNEKLKILEVVSLTYEKISRGVLINVHLKINYGFHGELCSSVLGIVCKLHPESEKAFCHHLMFSSLHLLSCVSPMTVVHKLPLLKRWPGGKSGDILFMLIRMQICSCLKTTCWWALYCSRYSKQTFSV